MIKTFIYLSSVLFSIVGFSQSFEVIYSTTDSEMFRYTFQDSENNLVVVGSSNSGSVSNEAHPLVIKLDEQGNIINENEFPKPDTSYNFVFGFQKANGNYFLMGLLADTNLGIDCAFHYNSNLKELNCPDCPV